MIELCKRLFGREPVNREPVNTGDIFEFRGNGSSDPFDKTKGAKVEVIAVSGNWVNYKMLPEWGGFNNESMELSSFRYCYKKS